MRTKLAVLLVTLLAAGSLCAQLPKTSLGPGIPTALPPSGAAGGALAGTYPNPSLAYVATNPQTGTTYAIVTGDRQKLVTLTNANPIAVSIAAAGSTGFADGWEVTVLNSGAGTATITPATSTIEGAATLVLTTGQAAKVWSNGTNYRAARIGKVAAATVADSTTNGVTAASTLASGALTVGDGAKGLSALASDIGVVKLSKGVPGAAASTDLTDLKVTKTSDTVLGVTAGTFGIDEGVYTPIASVLTIQSFAITAISTDNPGVITVAAGGMAGVIVTGDTVTIVDVTGTGCSGFNGTFTATTTGTPDTTVTVGVSGVGCTWASGGTIAGTGSGTAYIYGNASGTFTAEIPASSAVLAKWTTGSGVVNQLTTPAFKAGIAPLATVTLSSGAWATATDQRRFMSSQSLTASTPGAPASSVQYNNAGAFGGMSDTTWDDATRTLNFYSLEDPTKSIVVISADPNGNNANGMILNTNYDFSSPATVSGSAGDPGAAIDLFAILGGNTSIATSGTGGMGGSVTLGAGYGGTAPSAAVSSTGGEGGQASVSAKAGGSANQASNKGTNIGGLGGRLSLLGGNGGPAANGTSNTGGNGGGVFLYSGNGGNGSTAVGTDGSFNVIGGVQGNAAIQTWSTWLAGVSSIRPTGAFGNLACTAATLSTAIANAGDQCYCTDCKVTSAVDNTCAGSGSGAMAFNIAGTAKCLQ